MRWAISPDGLRTEAERAPLDSEALRTATRRSIRSSPHQIRADKPHRERVKGAQKLNEILPDGGSVFGVDEDLV